MRRRCGGHTGDVKTDKGQTEITYAAVFSPACFRLCESTDRFFLRLSDKSSQGQSISRLWQWMYFCFQQFFFLPFYTRIRTPRNIKCHRKTYDGSWKKLACKLCPPSAHNLLPLICPCSRKSSIELNRTHFFGFNDQIRARNSRLMLSAGWSNKSHTRKIRRI